MKAIKKLAALLLVLCMVTALCACSDQGTGNNNDNNTPSENVEASTAPSDEPGAESDEPAQGGDTADGFTTINEGKLTVATSPDFPPYEYLDDNGDVVGIEVDILKLIADKLGLELQIDPMDFDSALLAVQQGKSDMVVSGVTILPERQLVMNFTDSYTNAVQVIVVPQGSDVTLDNLGEQQIGVQRGTTGDIFTTDDYGEDHVTGYDSYTLVVQALLNGQIDCIVMDDAVAREYVAANPGLTILDTAYADEDYAFGIDKSNDALTRAVTDALNDLIADGTVGDIIARYING